MHSSFGCHIWHFWAPFFLFLTHSCCICKSAPLVFEGIVESWHVIKINTMKSRFRCRCCIEPQQKYICLLCLTRCTTKIFLLWFWTRPTMEIHFRCASLQTQQWKYSSVVALNNNHDRNTLPLRVKRSTKEMYFHCAILLF